MMADLVRTVFPNAISLRSGYQVTSDEKDFLHVDTEGNRATLTWYGPMDPKMPTSCTCDPEDPAPLIGYLSHVHQTVVENHCSALVRHLVPSRFLAGGVLHTFRTVSHRLQEVGISTTDFPAYVATLWLSKLSQRGQRPRPLWQQSTRNTWYALYVLWTGAGLTLNLTVSPSIWTVEAFYKALPPLRRQYSFTPRTCPSTLTEEEAQAWAEACLVEHCLKGAGG